MRRVNSLSREVGWRRAVSELIAPKHPNLCGYVLEAGRIDWSYFSDVSSRSCVLDLGSGWGTLTHWISSAVWHVVSIESVIDRAEFQTIRFAQEGLTNVTVLHASVNELPLQSKEYDLAIMNGLLEWLPGSKQSSSARSVQNEALVQVRTLLKPDGQLYIGIENRLGYQFLLGALDHSGLRYTSLMPRRIASLYVKLAQRFFMNRWYRLDAGYSEYRNYTYTAKGYRELLRQAGFDRIRIYTVAPDYNNPLVMYQVDDRKALAYYLDAVAYPGTQKAAVARLVARIPLIQLHAMLAPSFAIFARPA